MIRRLVFFGSSNIDDSGDVSLGDFALVWFDELSNLGLLVRGGENESNVGNESTIDGLLSSVGLLAKGIESSVDDRLSDLGLLVRGGENGTGEDMESTVDRRCRGRKWFVQFSS